jgi:hypothetical protein
VAFGGGDNHIQDKLFITAYNGIKYLKKREDFSSLKPSYFLISSKIMASNFKTLIIRARVFINLSIRASVTSHHWLRSLGKLT